MLFVSQRGLHPAVAPSISFLSDDLASLKCVALSFVYINILPVQKDAATTCSVLGFEAYFRLPWNAGTCTCCLVRTCDITIAVDEKRVSSGR